MEYKRTHKSLWFVENLDKIPENLGKIPKKTGKNGAQRLKKTFFGDHIKKCLHDLWRKKFVGKSRTKLFVQVCGNSGKNPSHLQNFASSYTYATSKSIEIQEVSMFREI